MRDPLGVVVVTTRHVVLLAGVGVVAAVCSLGTAGTVSAMAAAPAAPTVSSFVATPSSLGAAGGAVTLSADVSNAAGCTFTSKKPVTGAPATVPCSNGAVSDNVTVPANVRVKAIIYRFTLAVMGTKTVKARVAVTVASGLHIIPGAQWTLQKLQFPSNLFAGCTVQTFLPGHRWSDDAGDAGRYSGGGHSVSEPSKPRFELSATWNSTANEYIGYIFDQARPVYSITLSPGATAGC